MRLNLRLASQLTLALLLQTGVHARDQPAAPVVTIVPMGADSTGVKDASAAIAAAAARLPGGGRLRIVGRFLVKENLNIPVGVTLEGDCVLPGTPGSSSTAPYDVYACGVLLVSPFATISLSSGSGLKSLIVYRAGMAFPAKSSAAFAGTAITAAGDDVSLDHMMVMGFDKAFYSTGYQRARVDYLYGDNNNGIEIAHALDTPYISHCHMWPFAGIAATGAGSSLLRSGTAYYLHDTVDWGKISDSFSWGYARGVSLRNVNSVTVLSSGADNAFGSGPMNPGSIGIAIDGDSHDVRVIGGQWAAQAQAGIYINTSPGNVTTLLGNNVWGGSTHGVQIDGGDALISTNVFGGLVRIQNGVTINSRTSRVTLSNNRFGMLSGSLVNSTVPNSTTWIGSNDFGPHTGSVAGPNLSLPVVTAAASIDLPNGGDTFEIDGAASLETITAGWAGRTVTLIFKASITVRNGNGKAALRLSNDGDFVARPGSTLTLKHDGKHWFEVSRSP